VRVLLFDHYAFHRVAHPEFGVVFKARHGEGHVQTTLLGKGLKQRETKEPDKLLLKHPSGALAAPVHDGKHVVLFK
jgi:hypothetical protein